MKPFSLCTIKLGSGNYVASLNKGPQEEAASESMACELLADALEDMAKDIREYAFAEEAKRRAGNAGPPMPPTCPKCKKNKYVRLGEMSFCCASCGTNFIPS